MLFSRTLFFILYFVATTLYAQNKHKLSTTNIHQFQEDTIYSNKIIASESDIQIAFIADIHFQDIYGEFSDTNYKGIYNEKTNKHTLLRTMGAQLHSTRIFNENYFALFAALDDMVARGIKYVALPGDYTDDGQAIHLKGLERILKTYSTTYGMQFFITTGNHDPVGPFAQESGKSDFMGVNGKTQGIYSNPTLNIKKEGTLPDIISKDISKLGYKGVFSYLKSYGFFPQENYFYWATPFSNYNTETYTYKKALENASIEKRMYDVVPGYTIPDASYVVEPALNVWLLAIDANVYIPKDTISGTSLDPTNYKGASIGYKNVLSHKKHLLTWIKTIASEAKRLNKTLIAFSHYPIIDFNDDASDDLRKFFDGNKWQLERVPDEKVAKLLSDAGITIHVAGHMHINDTGIRNFSNGKSIVNIQTPSIAAYIPGYKILTIKSNNTVEVNTITISKVPNFDELFPLYEKEYAYLKESNQPLWNYDILKTDSYHDFTMFHLKELVRLRFLKDDWVSGFKDFMLSTTAEDLLLIPYLNADIDLKTLFDNKELHKIDWEIAKNKAEIALKTSHFSFEDFKHWTAFDLIFDFYRIRNADVLAINDIGIKQISLYKWLFKNYDTDASRKNTDLNKQKLKEFYTAFSKFLKGAPANNLIIDYNSGKLTNMDRI